MLLQSADMLFRELVQFAYNAECQLVISLPRVAARARNPELRALIEEHRAETVQHAQRLERIGDLLGFSAGGKISYGMQGILKEGDELLGYGGPVSLTDTALVGASRRVEHYEIAMYIALQELAGQIGAGEAEELLKLTLQEERGADEKLAKFSERPDGAMV